MEVEHLFKHSITAALSSEPESSLTEMHHLYSDILNTDERITSLTMDFDKTHRSMFSFILLFLMLPQWTPVAGWSYHHSNTTMDWNTARQWCRDRFTDMVAIQNHGEISHLNTNLPRVDGYYWIGIRKINNSWTWVGTNKKLTEEAKNWAKGEPNNGRNNEDCVEIYIKREKDEGKWNDESCRKRKTALCYTASCKKDSCSHHGECVETINNHTCECFEGFYGEECEHVVKCQAEEISAPDHGSVYCVHPNGNFSYDSQCEYTCNEGYQVVGSQTTRCEASAAWSTKPPTCELVQCSDLTEPLHGTMQCDHLLGSFSYQSSCEFSCEEGYTLTGSSSSKLMCEGSGHWNASRPICEAVRCPALVDPTNGRMNCSGGSFGSSCSFSCNDGFHLQGAPEITCTESAEWSQEKPYCGVVQCSDLTEPLHGSMQCEHLVGHFSYQSSCEFSCEEGYTLTGSNSSRLMCEASGHWNGFEPTCEAVQCPVLQDPTNGRIICSGESFGSSCSFSCNDGFHLQGAPHITCTESAGWSQEVPYCEVVQCSDLTEPLHGSMQCQHPLESFGYQSSCEFSCEDGYTLTGSSSGQLVCEATGHWNDSRPTCESVRCPTLEDPANGRISCGGDSYGSRCSFSCNDGFQLQGAPDITCTKSAEWNEEKPYCKVVQCSDLTEPLHGSMQCKHPLGHFGYQSSCEFSCEEGYTLTGSSSSKLMCEGSGHWNASRPICEAVRCPALVDPTNGRMNCSGGSFGSSCSFSCNDGFHLQGAPEITCTESAEWSQEKPYCGVVQCSDLTEPLHGSMQCEHLVGHFSYQSSCEFSCEEGYTLTGSNSSRLMCEASGHWNGFEPTCEAVQCPVLQDPTNGRIICSGESFGSSCSFSCNNGFHLQGAPHITCTESAGWSQEVPYCEVVQCSDLTEPLHGSMQCQNPLESFGYESSCEFSCEDGYTLTGSSSGQLVCEGTGHWNDSRPTCEPVRCPTLEDPANGRISCGGDSYGSRCSFSCNDGFQLQGAPDITCTKSAEWNEEKPYCKVVQCSDLTEPLHGSMQCKHPLGHFGYQSSCEFSCEEGYTLTGSSSSKLMCEGSGHWNASRPICEAVRCPALVDPTNGRMNCSGGSFGSSCSFSCNDGFHLQGAPEITCTESAEWSQEKPYCGVVQCSDLTEPLHGSMQCEHLVGHFSYQSSCEFSCEEGYTLTGSNSSRLMCEASGHWNGFEPTCEAVQCPVLQDPTNGRIICSGESFGSSCSFSCNNGFHLQGAPHITCTESAGWSQEVPYCEVVQCSDLTEPLHGSMQCQNPLESFGYESSCEFSCEDGYTLTGSSSGQLVCEGTGHWNDSRPTCEPVRCPTLEDPANGRISCGGDSYGSRCSFSCNDGFQLQGAPDITCTKSAEWNEEKPYCKVVQCSDLTEPLHGSMQCKHPLGHFSYQSSCEFSCEEGYTLTGSSSSKLMCEGSRHWNASRPICQAVRCPALVDPTNGRMNCSGGSFGSSCSFSCNDGFHLQGAPEITCTESAEWSQEKPYCEVVQCSDLTEPLHGSMQCEHLVGHFSYQSSCEFSCEEGYTLTGSNSSRLMCEASGHWNGFEPTCEAVQCPVLQDPTNGRIICSGESFGSSCSFSCDNGFHLQGAPHITCTESAGWSQEVPYCEVVQCSDLTEPLHGSMQCQHPLESFGYQSSCEFSCEDGYTLTGSSSGQLVCEGTGHWNDSRPTCEPVRCPTLEDPVNGRMKCSGGSFGSSCSFSCNDGFNLHGAPEMTCTESAEWSQEKPYCEVAQCSDLTEPLHGSMQCQHPLRQFGYQSSCEFSCEEGYTLTGSSSSRLMCEASGHWNDSQPICEAVRCPTLEDPTNGRIICSGESFGGSCSFSCNDGFHLEGAPEITCTQSAEWSQEKPYCEVVQCSDLTEPLHGFMQCQHPVGRFSHQSSCEFSCEDGYTLTGSSSGQLVCEGTGHWNDSRPTCEPVTCPYLQKPDNGLMNCSSEEATVGTSCSFSCLDGYTLLGDEVVTCNFTGGWSGAAAECQAPPEPQLSPPLVTGLTVAGGVSLSSLALALWIMKKLRQKAEKFDLSKSDIDMPPQVYKSIDSLI
ncbi:sushi, von Willebrand factor type A, EGF and pentraxin domain-containing protein 1-like isoform X6 [Pygocentrus nattereri]|uniref:sushi, von Willebrand factor type A, EGF and pentraxin domain-containing protein 1-like isoform X6 n=1 Tax=Pygocentrus nattereri TaxID=42514 RepID=UPI001890B793|nr:sushi, von Willebrand factor type A, EGF and pentraxin domain-containing protein 1-like isoform X6 [Pygocentrus nattereri]